MKSPRPWFLLLLLAAGLSSCLSSPDAWSFCCTRAVYGRPLDPKPDSDVSLPISGTGEAAWIVPVLLLLPLAIDLVILPVTLAHDLARA